MVIIWVFLEVLFLFFYFSLPPVGQDKKSDILDQSKSHGVEPASSTCHEEDDESDFKNDNSTESSPLVGPGQIQSSLAGGDTTNYGTMPPNTEKPHKSCSATLAGLIKHFLWLVSELIREEPVVLLGVIFIALFDNLTLEVGAHLEARRNMGAEKWVSLFIHQHL